ncbi:MAG: RusA family crossover junction endodeoxyribonuclease, partial [Spirochaetaceae bacterium]|nr:RusA family crossover junction endodeoxyribonuclease [Spirochaetaceae bacterium]
PADPLEPVEVEVKPARLTLEIPGTPIAKKRPRFFVRGKHVGAYNSQGTEEGKFLQQAMDQLLGHQLIPAGTPIRLECWFLMPVPKSMPKGLQGQVRANLDPVPHTKKPDLDNLIKFFKDCFNKIVWTDDSQVVRIAAYKVYSFQPATIIKLWW